MIDVQHKVEAGNKEFEIVYKAMAYQIAKDIGAYATVLCGDVDAIIITGGVAYDKMFVGWIKEHVSFIAPVKVFPGEEELRPLADSVLRVLNGTETPKIYQNI